jgi:alkylation response protein AidB-like acyl-CoA dehydrogenase
LNDAADRATAVVEWLRAYAPRIDVFAMDERRCMPPHVVLDLGNAGVLGMLAPQRYGGLELRYADWTRVIEQLGAIDTTVALFVGVHNALGIRPIVRFGAPALCDEALPALASGRALGALAITEAGAGSNPRAMKATGVRQPDGGFTLTGVKWWSGNASMAGWINVFVRLADSSRRVDTITGFALGGTTPGLRCGRESMTMGVRGMVQCAVHLEGAQASEKQLLGTIGRGMEVAFDAFSCARLGIAAIALGAIKRCAQFMLGHADARVVGAGPLIAQPLTQERLSFAVSAAASLEALLGHICAEFDRGQDVAPELFIVCKTAAPELLWTVADACLQLHGGRGYSEENPIAHLFRDARLLRIFEGPTETLNHALGVTLLHDPARSAGMLRSIGGVDIADRVDAVLAEVTEAPARLNKGGLIQAAADCAGRMLTDAVLAIMARRAGCPTDHMERRLARSIDRFTTRARQQAGSFEPVRVAIAGFSSAIGEAPAIDWRQ